MASVRNMPQYDLVAPPASFACLQLQLAGMLRLARVWGSGVAVVVSGHINIDGNVLLLNVGFI
jgi:hypothetical protein